MRVVTCLCLLLLSIAGPLDAQRAGSGWAFAVGPRAGVELDTSDFTVGGQLRVHPGWPGFIELQGSSTWTFLNDFTERQINADLLLVRAGVAVGGGPVWMNTVFPDETGKRTEAGWSFVIIAGGNPTMDSEWYTPVIEFRLTDVDVFSPRHFTLGFGWPVRF